MTVRVGVIGAGMIGEDHIRRLSRVLSGVSVVAITDVDAQRARAIAEKYAVGRVHADGQAVIADDGVDGVLVTSWGPTHEEYVLACLAAGKPVFCEKPLATTAQACSRIVDAEVAGGARLVQVGYMRRYDAAYRALKDVVASGAIGAPTLMHATHRNPTVPGHYTGESAINDTAVHDIDVTRWLFDEEIVATRVLTPRRNSRAAEHLADPILLLLETESGVLVEVEVNVNVDYGYDIRGEVVGETGTAALAERSLAVVRSGGQVRGAVPADWRERFITAYDVELQEWVDGVRDGVAGGPSSWDGYAAAVVSDAALQAMASGERVPVALRDKPDLFAK